MNPPPPLQVHAWRTVRGPFTRTPAFECGYLDTLCISWAGRGDAAGQAECTQRHSLECHETVRKTAAAPCVYP